MSIMKGKTEDQLDDAVKDLLVYCGTPGRKLATGSMFGPVLVEGWNGEQTVKLVEAMEELVEDNLILSRREAGVAHPTATMLPEDVVKADLKGSNERLEALTLLWAFYLKRLDIDQLATLASYHRRNTYNRLADGRAIIIRELLRLEHLKADQADLLPSSPLRKPRNVREFLVVSAVGILLLALANLLLSSVPQLSVGVLLVLGGLRLSVHSWRLGNTARHGHRDREELTWQSLRVLYWVVLCSWTVVLFQNAQRNVSTLDQFSEHLAWLTTYVTIAVSMLFSSAIDLLLWVKRENASAWPWDKLQRYAANVYNGRWIMLGLEGMLVVVIIVIHVGPRLSLLP